MPVCIHRQNGLSKFKTTSTDACVAVLDAHRGGDPCFTPCGWTLSEWSFAYWVWARQYVVCCLVVLSGALRYVADGRFVSGPSHAQRGLLDGHPVGGPRSLLLRMGAQLAALRVFTPTDGHSLSGPSHAGYKRFNALSVHW